MIENKKNEFHILFYHCGLELCREKIFRKIPSIKNDAMRRNKKTFEILFDRSTHTISKFEKELEGRGRPDILHSSLLNAMYSPLLRNKELILHVSTINSLYFRIPNDWRLPVNYKRFYSLIEHFFNKKSISFGDKEITLEKKSIEDIISDIKPKSIFNLTSNADKELKKFQIRDKTLFLIGCYQKGEFSTQLLRKLTNNNIIFDAYMDKNQVFPAWRITSKLIFLIEENLLNFV